MSFKMLQIIDVSSYLYSGMGTSFGARAQYKGIPTGGIYGLLQQVAMTIKNKDIPVLVFDSQTNAREILPEYKGSRSRNPKIRFQNDLVHRYIQPALNNTFKVEGYEADWLAYNFAEKYRGHKNLGFTFRTVDYDWCHNIVTPRDTMVPAVGGHAEVMAENFERVFSGRDHRVPLNSLTAKKCFFGDKSDGISPLGGVDGYTDTELFKAFLIYSENIGMDKRDKETMVEYVTEFSDIFGDKKEHMLNRIEVLYPRVLDNLDLLDLQIAPKDLSLLTTICSLTGCKSIANRLGIGYYEDMGDLQQEVMREYQQQYGVERTQLFEERIPNDSGGVVIPDRGGFNL